MVGHSQRGLRYCLFLGLLFFSIGGYCSDALKSLTTLETHRAFQLFFPESSWLLNDLDGDNTPDFATGQRLGRTTDGYLYRVQLQLSSDATSSSFTVFHNNALGLRITSVDIDGDDDIDLIISDRFFRQHIAIWLNDGKGHFVKSLPGRFSPNSGSDLAFVAVDLKCAAQATVDKQHRRFPDYLGAVGYILPLLLKRPALKQHPFEWLFHFAADSLRPRGPPTVYVLWSPNPFSSNTSS